MYLVNCGAVDQCKPDNNNADGTAWLLATGIDADRGRSSCKREWILVRSEVSSDTFLIPKNTSVVVRRVPATRPVTWMTDSGKGVGNDGGAQ